MQSLMQSEGISVIALAMIAVLLLVTETGYRSGRARRHQMDDASRAQVGTIQAAVLGLLALLLGFTFSMAVSRYDARKQLVLEETNAIGTTYLRAQLLAEPARGEATSMLRDYVRARIEFYRAIADPARRDAAAAKVERLQNALWAQAVKASSDPPHSPVIALFVASTNEMIDVHAKRIAALENNVPEIVLLLLFVVAMLAMGLVGYGQGLGTRRNIVATTLLSILVALVIAVIVDIDRPRRGLIQVGQGALTGLLESMEATKR